MNNVHLRRDFIPFIDPATEFRVMEGSHGIRFQFVRNGIDHDYFIDFADQSVIARHLRGRKYASVRSLLASSDFADIKALTSTQLRILKNFDIEKLISPEGEINTVNLTRTSLQQCVAVSPSNSTPNLGLVLIDGPAGVGKTSLIQALLVQRAKRHQEAAVQPPILHVASRGKKISVQSSAC
jgi:hypothetical protein